MDAIVTFFPVDNGDMTLIQLGSGRTILIDINIRATTGEGIRDVLADLRARLRRDAEGRHYVDAMLLTHPDQDHCRGFKEHFHLGPLADYVEPGDGLDGKIVVCEMWSSPMVFRRRPKGEALCADARAWATEARRRAELFKAKQDAIRGDRIQIMGEDSDGKTDDMAAVLVKSGQDITRIDGEFDGTFRGFLIAPKGQGSADDEERRSNNHSSVIVRFSLASGVKSDAVLYLAGGDALVGIWDRVWEDHKHESEVLAYHLLGAPHHCSWRSLSWSSWSESEGRAKPSDAALLALGQAEDGAFVVASSRPVVDDDVDPPCIGAKREYVRIVSPGGGQFVNTAEHMKGGEPTPMEFRVTPAGPVLQQPGSELGVAAAGGLTARALKEAAERRPPVIKRGDDRFA